MIDKPISIVAGRRAQIKRVDSDNLPYYIKSASSYGAGQDAGCSLYEADRIVVDADGRTGDGTRVGVRPVSSSVVVGHSSSHRKMKNDWTRDPFISPEAHYQQRRHQAITRDRALWIRSAVASDSDSRPPAPSGNATGLDRTHRRRGGCVRRSAKDRLVRRRLLIQPRNNRAPTAQWHYTACYSTVGHCRSAV